MDSVMRFDPTYERGLPCMKMHPYGCYVDYQDYAKLLARVRELEGQVSLMKAGLNQKPSDGKMAIMVDSTQALKGGA